MRPNPILQFTILIALCLVGIFVALTVKSLYVLILFCFVTVICAALLIAWSAECAEYMISQGLAVAIVAILQVLPEFFVEAAIAWNAAIDPANFLHLITANFTGANRLLIGVGWPLIFFTAEIANYRRTGKLLGEIQLRKEHSIEVFVLLIATLYYIIILAKQSITLVDTVILSVCFAWYMWTLSRLPAETGDPKLMLRSCSLALLNVRKALWRKVAIIALFLIGGVTLFFVAEPFLLSIRGLAIILFGTGAVYFFVQWIAPFLSEFPESTSAFYWAQTEKLAPMGLLNLISSKVNQWTMLVAMVPIVYAVGVGAPLGIPLDMLQVEEIFLTMIQSVYGAVCLFKLRLTRFNATVLLTLWTVQFAVPALRMEVALAYLPLIVYELVRYRRQIIFFTAFTRTLTDYDLLPRRISAIFRQNSNARAPEY